LGFTLMIGAFLVGAALTLHLRLSFELISLLAILTAWGLGRVISRLLKPEQRQQGDRDHGMNNV
jgi:membrane protein implicated in regulation of membrane protease activity